MSAERISLGQQLEAVRFAAERQKTLNGGATLREHRAETVRDYDLKRLLAAVETLTWLKDNAAAVKAAHRALAAPGGEA
jgi:hypothetical protein